ncbi:hypothetical protein [Rhodococcus wratislaviensis]|uniref:hypothetical protein n=1 Tax=Rhodococcus wratislaviensis TaxID=44752 RepID=UPI001FE534CB|nr:hypothetical protein [Rhodococcus wratislaviensis]
MLSELTVRQEPRDGRLIAVPPAGLDLTRSLHAIRRSGTRIRGSLGDFLTLAAHHPQARNRRRRRRGHRTGPGRDLRRRALRYGHRRTYRGDLLQLRGAIVLSLISALGIAAISLVGVTILMCGRAAGCAHPLRHSRPSPLPL